MNYFHLKDGFEAEFTVYDCQMMKEVALTLSTLYDVYRSFAPYAQ